MLRTLLLILMVTAIVGCRGHDRSSERYVDRRTGFELALPAMWQDSVRISVIGDAERDYFWPGADQTVELLYEPIDPVQNREALARLTIYPLHEWSTRRDAILFGGSRLVSMDSARAYVLWTPRTNPYPMQTPDAARFARFSTASDSLRELLEVESPLPLPSIPSPVERMEAIIADPQGYVTREISFELGDASSVATGYFRGGYLVLIDEQMNRGEYGSFREQYLVINHNLAYFRRTGSILWHDADSRPSLRPAEAELAFDAEGTSRVRYYRVDERDTDMRASEIQGIQRHFEELRDRLLAMPE